MDYGLKEKLEGLIYEELIDLENEVLTEQEKTKAIDRIKSYNEVLDSIEKRENEIPSESEKDKKSKIIFDRAIRIGEILVMPVVTIVGYAVYSHKFNQGLEFEKEGTVSSFFLRDWISKRMKK